MSIATTAAFDVMFERATRHAERLGHGRVMSEHVLLALLDDSDVVDLLHRVGLTTHDLADSIRARVPIGTDRLFQAPGLSVEAQEILVCAQEEVEGFGHTEVSGAHALIGILREPEGLAGRLLESYGMGIDSMRHEVLEFLAERDGFGGDLEFEDIFATG